MHVFVCGCLGEDPVQHGDRRDLNGRPGRDAQSLARGGRQ
jgi:hypothetical protein